MAIQAIDSYDKLFIKNETPTTILRPASITSGLVANWKFNNSYVDSIASYTLTPNGGTSFGMNDYFNSLEYSVYLPDSPYLSITEASCPAIDFNGASSYFTFACWVKYLGTHSTHILFKKGTQYSAAFGSASAALEFTVNGVTASFATGANVGEWQHFAFSYDGTNLNIYKNGVLVKSQAQTTGAANTASDFWIGTSSGADALNAYVKDFAVYSRALTASEVKSIGSVFIDSSTASTKEISPAGSAKVLPIKLNKSAGFFAADATSVRVPASSDWTGLGTGQWTIEFYINTSSVAAAFYPFNIAGTNASFDYLFIGWGGSGWYVGHKVANVLTYVVNNVADAGFTANNWHHIAVVRDASNVWRLYRNGIQITSGTLSSDLSNLASYMDIGGYYNPSAYSIWMKELRVSNTCRYPSGTTFTPTTTQFVSDSNTKLLMHFDTPAECPIGPAIYMDGTGDYLKVVSSTDFNYGTGDYTQEGWVCFAAVAQKYMINRSVGGASNDCDFIYNGAGEWLITTGASSLSSGAGYLTPVAGQWIHWAMVRSGTTRYMFIDGRLANSDINSTNISTSGDIYFNILGNGALPFNGWIKHVRFSNVARYTAAFTPSQTGYAVDSNTKLYVKGDENNGVTTFVDSETTPKTVTTFGDTKIAYTQDYRSAIFKDDGNTGHKPYPAGNAKIDFFALGVGVGYFPTGTGNYASIPDTVDVYFDGDFTQECYIRLSSLGASIMLFGQSTGALDATVLYYEWSTPYLGYRDYVANSNVLAFQGDPKWVVNTWYHVALTRSGNTWTIWNNGTSVATTSSATTLSNVAGNFYVGADNAVTWSFSGTKLMDNIRIAKGVARYTAAFNPPFEVSSSGAGVSATSTFFMIF